MSDERAPDVSGIGTSERWVVDDETRRADLKRVKDAPGWRASRCADIPAALGSAWHIDAPGAHPIGRWYWVGIGRVGDAHVLVVEMDCDPKVDRRPTTVQAPPETRSTITGLSDTQAEVLGGHVVHAIVAGYASPDSVTSGDRVLQLADIIAGNLKLGHEPRYPWSP